MISIAALLLLAAAGTAAADEVEQAGKSATTEPIVDELLALERGAIDRWMRFDPQGYLDLYASDFTYFDPMVERRIDGLDAMKAWVAPMKSMKSPITDARYEIVDPKVQRRGDVAVLTFNSLTYGKVGDAPEAVVARWNVTEVYTRMDGRWKIIHSHFSWVKPERKLPAL